jgi:hypothetical protein
VQPIDRSAVTVKPTEGDDHTVEDDDTHLGATFWLVVIGATLGFGIGLIALFILIEAVWYRWSLAGALLLLFVVACGIAYIHDRRAQRRYERLPA